MLGKLCEKVGEENLSKSRLERLVLRMRAYHYWTNYCIRRLIDMISKTCPNLIYLDGFLKEGAALNIQNKSVSDNDLARYVEAKYAAIVHKSTQLRLAEESRIGMMAELALLLKEAGADQEEEVLSASLLQNFAEGGVLLDDFVHTNTKSRAKHSNPHNSGAQCGSDVLHLQYGQYLDLVNMFECQLQYEDIFWKWLLPPQSVSSSADPFHAKLANSVSALEGVLFASLMTSKPSGNGNQDSLKAAIENVDRDFLDRLVVQDGDNVQAITNIDVNTIKEDILDRLMRHCILTTTPYCSELAVTAGLQEDLQNKRENWREAINNLIQAPNPHCPYDMVLK
ncbi:hypothetical protein EON65_49890 [archaeon]|nr:MAG: hypothetical protein EON65_49890 [archaeon]